MEAFLIAFWVAYAAVGVLGFICWRRPEVGGCAAEWVRAHPWHCLAVAAAIPFLTFVWPTPYRYEVVASSVFEKTYSHVVRINRFTGSASTIYLAGE